MLTCAIQTWYGQKRLTPLHPPHMGRHSALVQRRSGCGGVEKRKLCAVAVDRMQVDGAHESQQLETKKRLARLYIHTLLGNGWRLHAQSRWYAWFSAVRKVFINRTHACCRRVCMRRDLWCWNRGSAIFS